MKQRPAIVERAMEHGSNPASERVGLDRKTICEWRDRNCAYLAHAAWTAAETVKAMEHGS